MVGQWIALAIMSISNAQLIDIFTENEAMEVVS